MECPDMGSPQGIPTQTWGSQNHLPLHRQEAEKLKKLQIRTGLLLIFPAWEELLKYNIICWEPRVIIILAICPHKIQSKLINSRLFQVFLLLRIMSFDFWAYKRLGATPMLKRSNADSSWFSPACSGAYSTICHKFAAPAIGAKTGQEVRMVTVWFFSFSWQVPRRLVTWRFSLVLAGQ